MTTLFRALPCLRMGVRATLTDKDGRPLRESFESLLARDLRSRIERGKMSDTHIMTLMQTLCKPSSRVEFFRGKG